MSASTAAWKREIRRLQHDCCYICGAPVSESRPGNWDHFVPKVFSGGEPLRVGLSFWTHNDCNAGRGHTPPTGQMITRALSVINAMPDKMQHEAAKNIQAALAIHQGYVATLTRLMVTPTRLASNRERIAAAVAALG